MKLLLPILLLAAVLVPVPAAAKDKFNTCIDKAGGSDFAASECWHAELDRQDARLNAAYKKLMASLDDPGEREELRTAQRAWIAYRDADASFRYSIAHGATLDSLMALMSTTNLTETRAKELETLILQ